jgi:DNA invertase Pin-like site-specific DNA recombinase
VDGLYGYRGRNTAALESERELIRARTGEGRARAKARGVKLGRKLQADAVPEARSA